MKRHAVLETVSEDNKLFKIVGFGVDLRQGAIVMGAFFALSIVYQYVSMFLPVSPMQATVAFSPVFVAAFVIAFFKHDGRHLDWWIYRRYLRLARPRTLVWRRPPLENEDPEAMGANFALAPNPTGRRTWRERLFGRRKGGSSSPSSGAQRTARPAPPPAPHRGGGAQRKRRKKEKTVRRFKTRAQRRAEKKARSHRALRDSIQRALPAEQIVNDMVRTSTGTYLMVFEVKPVSMSTVGFTERERIWAAARALYNRIDFPIIELTRSREGSIESYSERLKERIVNGVRPEEHNRALFARDHLKFLKNIVKQHGIYDRRGYVVLPYRPENADLKSRRRRNPGARSAIKLQKEAEAVRRELTGRYEILHDAFSHIGAQLVLLRDDELLSLLKDQAGAGDELTDLMDGPWEPITLQYKGYDDLSPKKLERVLKAVQKHRKEAPPAISMGDLTVADKISPDNARVHSDYVKIGDRYHSTIFVIRYPPDVGFGDLRNLLNVDGRVKVVRYIQPIAQEKAVHMVSRKVAEMIAADHTAADGNVATANQRRMTKYSAEIAMSELQSGNQGFFHVSFYVHVEADSKQELFTLRENVRTKLTALRARAKVAREEAWEGYVSTLPLAENALSKRYAQKALLTDALADWFIFGNYTLDHKDGILMGLDPYSGGLILLDPRELTNPNIVMLGQSGSGKTNTSKAMTTRLMLQGHRVVILDPVGNSGYGAVAKHVDGQYVVFGIGSRHRFNPCEIGENYLNLQLLMGADEDEDPDAARKRARGAALDGKIRTLTRMIDLMIGGGAGERQKVGLTAGEEGLVDRAWHEVYADKGITQDPDTHSRPAPLMKDFFEKCGEIEGLKDLRARLYSWEFGALRSLFDGPTNVNLDNRYLVLQVSGIADREKAVVEYALLDFLNGKLSNPEEPSDLVVEELWSPLKYKQSADFIEEMYRTGRARNNSVVGVTQELTEFLRSDQGKVIMRLASTHLVLKQQKKTADILDEFLDLSEDQKKQLATMHKGQGFLSVDGNLVPLYVVCSAEELRLFNTDPKLEKQYRDNERAASAANRRAGTGPARLDAATIEGVTGGLLKPTPHGLVKELLAEDGDYVPEPGDYELAVPADGDPEAVAALAESLRAEVGLNDGRDPHTEGEPVWAVTGTDAARVAYNLAGVAAKAGRPFRQEVLFVDAEGYYTRHVFARTGAPRPDAMLAGNPEETLASLVRRNPDTGLCVVARPADTGLLPSALAEAARRRYDLVIVAGGGEDPYATGWLAEATSIVQTVGPGEAAAPPEAVEREARDRQLIVAPLDAATGRVPRPSSLWKGAVVELPARERLSRGGPGAFAGLDDPEVGRPFGSLLEALISKQEDPTATAERIA